MKGIIAALVSSRPDDAAKVASGIGKASDKGPISIYYKKLESDLVLSLLVPSTYPNSIIEAASAASLSNYVAVLTGYELDWHDGELFTLAHLSRWASKRLVLTPLPEKVQALLHGSSMDSEFTVREPSVALLTEISQPTEHDDGLVYVDRGFNVKGVGTVILGFSKTKASVHEKFKALPLMKDIEVKSIEVLDEPIDEVGPDVRVGFAVKGIDADEAKDVYLLVKDSVEVLESVEGTINIYPWSETLKEGSLYHLAVSGVVAPAVLKELTHDRALFRLQRPLPRVNEYIIVNVNARPGRSRVAGLLIVE